MGVIMPNYRRASIKGGLFFFTVVLEDRTNSLLVDQIDRLRSCYRAARERRPFDTIAICVLPDHLHAIWALPENDADYAIRWNMIKSSFSRGLKRQTTSRGLVAKREKGIWQRRYWEHAIRNDADLDSHLDYIHYNPVKHGLVSRVADWPHSSFHRFVERGWLASDWGGDVKAAAGSYGE